MDIFSQILELDESEDDREFSRDMVFAYFGQVEETFEKLDRALCVGTRHFMVFLSSNVIPGSRKTLLSSRIWVISSKDPLLQWASVVCSAAVKISNTTVNCGTRETKWTCGTMKPSD